jgi:hypothetical protein
MVTTTTHSGDFGDASFEAASFAQELFVTSIASGAVGGAASAFIGGGGSDMARPALAKGAAIALATAIAESAHTLLDRQSMNPLQGAAMLMGPGLTGVANIAINRAQIIRAPQESAALSFVVGAGSEVAGRYIGDMVLGGFKQLPKH